MLVCCICEQNIQCECLNDQYIRIKFRICFLRKKKFPKSQLNSNRMLIHICSKMCNEMK